LIKARKFCILVLGAMIMTLLRGPTVNAQPEQGYAICTSRPPLASVPQALPGTLVSALSFGSYRLKESTGTLNFHNTFQREIAAVELLVEYEDAANGPTVVMPYAAAIPEARKTFESKLKLHTELINDLHDTLIPGGASHMIGESFSIVRSCPAKAKISYLHVFFADGHAAEWGMRGWKTEPTIRQAPLTLDFPCAAENPSRNLYLRVKIGAEGKISDFHLLAAARWPCLDALKNVVERWTFYPALSEGDPSASELNVLLRFDRKPGSAYGFVNIEELSSDPIVVIDLVQSQAKPGEWVLVYGPEPFGILND
jgi:hypothetical protein